MLRAAANGKWAAARSVRSEEARAVCGGRPRVPEPAQPGAALATGKHRRSNHDDDPSMTDMTDMTDMTGMTGMTGMIDATGR